MNKPIIGVTVGTPMNPNRIDKQINAVKSVNGVEPDENGNVNTEIPNIITDEDVIKLQSTLQ